MAAAALSAVLYGQSGSMRLHSCHICQLGVMDAAVKLSFRVAMECDVGQGVPLASKAGLVGTCLETDVLQQHASPGSATAGAMVSVQNGSLSNALLLLSPGGQCHCLWRLFSCVIHLRSKFVAHWTWLDHWQGTRLITCDAKCIFSGCGSIICGLC